MKNIIGKIKKLKLNDINFLVILIVNIVLLGLSVFFCAPFINSWDFDNKTMIGLFYFLDGVFVYLFISAILFIGFNIIKNKYDFLRFKEFFIINQGLIAIFMFFVSLINYLLYFLPIFIIINSGVCLITLTTFLTIFNYYYFEDLITNNQSKVEFFKTLSLFSTYSVIIILIICLII
jgi:hypothetical protein